MERAMMPRAELQQFGKLVAREIATGRMGEGSRMVGDVLASGPDCVHLVVDLLLAEGRKKRPDERIMMAFGVMIGIALDVLRMHMENHQLGAKQTVASLTAKLAEGARTGSIDPLILLLVGQQFAAAKLDIGDELRNAMGGLFDELAGVEHPKLQPGEDDGYLPELAASLDHNPFLIHAELADLSASFPDEQRLAMIGTLIDSEITAIRAASLGWLLDPSGRTSQGIAAMLQAAASKGLVSPESTGRMIAMRNWLAADRRESLDAAIRACREIGGVASPAGPMQVREVLASGCDGAGAQSILAIVKRERSFSVVSLLVKHGIGVREALVREGMTKGEAEGILDQACAEVDHLDASLEFVSTCLAHALDENLQSGTPPPFGLIQCLEVLGLAGLNPARITVEALIAKLLDGVPAEHKTEASIKRALDNSMHWPAELGLVDSWFEQNDDVRKLLAATQSRNKRMNVVLDQVLPARRRRWAELLAWTATAMREDEGCEDWMDFAMVARELLGDRPLRDIPVAEWIATGTVDAFESRL
jgi:hypothetical protein